MEKNIFIQRVAEQFELSDQAHVTAEVSFRDLATWDSLTGMSIQSMIEEEYGVEVSDDEFISVPTFGDLFVLVQEKKQ